VSLQILHQAIWFVANPADAAASMFVLEPCGLRLARWDGPKKMQEQKIDCFKNKAARNVRTASLCSFISAWLVFSPLPVPTDRSDFLPEPSALLS
jgi:hypothetical protein